MLPERIQLRTKLTKRCPQPSCRHLLIQPDSKSTRLKIKMVAYSYLPNVEIGRRRHLHRSDRSEQEPDHDAERRRSPPDEPMNAPLSPGGKVCLYQDDL